METIGRRRVLSLQVSTGKYPDFVQHIMALAKKKQSSYVCVSNVHMCIEAVDDPAFAQRVNEADLVTPDGMPLINAIRLLYREHYDRVPGMDLMPSLLAEIEKQAMGVYFYGGSPEMLLKTEAYLKKTYPGITDFHFYSPPFRALDETEKSAIVTQIRASGAQIIFVVLGCPKQERWMAEHKGKIDACMLGIGGALPVMIGMQKRAPMWMQKASLEWFYRFMREPRRLFKRYFYTNNKFLFLLFKEWLKSRFSKEWKLKNHNK